MTLPLSLRRALAAPLALSLALGGALLGATSASAAPGDLALVSPALGQTTDSRTVTVSGTVERNPSYPTQRTIRVTGSEIDFPSTTTVATDGSFTVPVPFSDEAGTAQTITVDVITAGTVTDSETRSFSIPPLTTDLLRLISPAGGSTTESRDVVFRGSADFRSTVVVTTASGQTAEGDVVRGEGFRIPVTFADDAAVAQTVTVREIDGNGDVVGTVERSFFLPAVIAPEPAITLTTPTEGSTTATREVTFSGTAPRGTIVILETLGAYQGEQLVREDGTFSLTYAFADTDEVAQTALVRGLVDGTGAVLPAVERTFSLPAVVQPTYEGLVLTSPAQDSEVGSDTVTFSGTLDSAPAGQRDVVLTGADVPSPVTIPVDADGTFTGEVTFADGAAVQQFVTVVAYADGVEVDGLGVVFTLPVAFELTSPADGSLTTSRTVEFVGTASPDAEVVLYDGDRYLATALPDAAGRFSTTVTFGPDAGSVQLVTLTAVVDGAPTGTIERRFSVPALTAPEPDPQPEPEPQPEPVPTVTTPVVTAPTAGQIVTGDAVTISGTGTPGTNVVVVIAPTDPAGTVPEGSDAPIVVDEDGTWTVTVTLAPGSWTVSSVATLLGDDGRPVLGDDGLPVLSDPSAEVDFTVSAAVVPTPTTPALPTLPGLVPAAPTAPIALPTTLVPVHVTTPVAPTTASGLAYTGSDSSGVSLALAAALALVGIALVRSGRRRASVATSARHLAGE